MLIYCTASLNTGRLHFNTRLCRLTILLSLTQLVYRLFFTLAYLMRETYSFYTKTVQSPVSCHSLSISLQFLVYNSSLPTTIIFAYTVNKNGNKFHFTQIGSTFTLYATGIGTFPMCVCVSKPKGKAIKKKPFKFPHIHVFARPFCVVPRSHVAKFIRFRRKQSFSDTSPNELPFHS